MECILMSNAKVSLIDKIEQEIATGQFRQGDRLDEVSLAKRFGVSRTPVREALNYLATIGLIDLRPRRGAIVAEMQPDQLFSMFEAMAELEAVCGRLAARRLTPHARTELSEVHHACGMARHDSDAYYEKNELFHQAIYRASGNAYLEAQCLAFQKRLRPYRRLQLQVINRVGDSYQEHERIMAMILSGKGEVAAAELRNHVAIQGERFSDLIAGLSRMKAA
jgi:DNA-binding GntR family transcriptional regulator